jgi:hypothetical protein
MAQKRYTKRRTDMGVKTDLFQTSLIRAAIRLIRRFENTTYTIENGKNLSARGSARDGLLSR